MMNQLIPNFSLRINLSSLALYILMIFNCSARAGKAGLPAGNWQILADGETSFHWQEEELVCEKVPVAEFSAMLLGLK